MVLNNSDELQSLVLEVLGQAVGALSLTGETTESPEDTKFSSHSAPRFGRACTAQI